MISHHKRDYLCCWTLTEREKCQNLQFYLQPGVNLLYQFNPPPTRTRAESDLLMGGCQFWLYLFHPILVSSELLKEDLSRLQLHIERLLFRWFVKMPLHSISWLLVCQNTHWQNHKAFTGSSAPLICSSKLRFCEVDH